MKLCSIIIVWGDCLELLPFCINNHLQFSDGVIVVWSEMSNHGAKDGRMLDFVVRNNWKDLPGCYAPEHKSKYQNVLFHQFEPVKRLRPAINETRKRNYGIDLAYKNGYTHMLISDADEMYKPEELRIEKERFKNTDLNGMVHRIKVFVGSPTLCCMDNNTLVPGIQKLEKHTEVGTFRKYPFAYDKMGTAKIDGTRRTNVNSGVIMSEFFMYHFSYLRKNIDLKIANSSANLGNRSAAIKRDIANAKPGHVSELYGNALEGVENYFDIQI